MRLYTACLREGIDIAVIPNLNDINQAGYIHPILQKLRGDSDVCTEINVDNILMCRKYSGGYDIFLPSDSQNGQCPYFQLVRIFYDATDNTTYSVNKWGKELALAFNEIRNDLTIYKYTLNFKFYANVSQYNECNNSYQYSNEVFKNDDVVSLLNKIYPSVDYSKHEQVRLFGKYFFLGE